MFGLGAGGAACCWGWGWFGLGFGVLFWVCCVGHCCFVVYLVVSGVLVGWCILGLGNCCVDLRCGLDCCCGCLLCWLMPVGLLIWLVSCWFGLVVLTFVVGYVAVLTSCAL